MIKEIDWNILKERISEYHEMLGDREAKLIRFLDEDNYCANNVLVRVIDASGASYSVIDSVFVTDDNDEFTYEYEIEERFFSPECKEDTLTQAFNEGEFCLDDDEMYDFDPDDTLGDKWWRLNY